MNRKIELAEKASDFIRQCYTELGCTDQIKHRLKEIWQQIEETGSYEHSYTELAHGAKMAWRNSNRCIGRLFWNSLHVLDARNAKGEKEIVDALFHHIDYATNDGKIRPTITIFKQDQENQEKIIIYNSQLISYAGYQTEVGTVGDPHAVQFTEFCETIGWKGERQEFEVLPIVLSIDGNEPVWHQIPAHLVKEIELEHPELPFQTLGLKWYAVPFISGMRLEIGGISYSAAPFNGWYTGAEIGARNFADHDRYNMLPAVAEIMGLSLKGNGSLWKDQALLELNVAVLYSFKKQKVTIVDHHTAAEQFRIFEKKEAACNRHVTGDWRYLIPPMSPSTTHMFHKDYEDRIVTPNFFPHPFPEEWLNVLKRE